MTKPLLLVRTKESAEAFSRCFELSGYTTIKAPVQTIKPLFPNPALVASFLARSDIVMCLSQNAVRQLHLYQGKLRTEAECWAVGKNTARKLSALMGNVSSPSIESSEGLWQCIRDKITTGNKVTIVKGVGGRDTLIKKMSPKGALVQQLNLYQRIENISERSQIIKSVDENQVNTAIIGSSELLDIATRWWSEWLPGKTLLVPSERVAARARQLGANDILVANGATADDFLNLLQNGKSA